MHATGPFDPAGINLRNEFGAIMAQHGHWAVLRRRLQPPTTDRNPQTHEGESLANMGEGAGFVDEFVKVRKMNLVGSPEAPNDPTPGRASAPVQVFWLQHTKKPNRGDFLMEIAQDELSLGRRPDMQPLLPYVRTRLYDIQQVDDMREAGGRTEFFRLVVEQADLGDMG